MTQNSGMNSGRVEGQGEVALEGKFSALPLIGVWLILCAILLLVNAANISNGLFPDPDDGLRLIQVMDLLEGQAWFDLHQYRINSPDGTLMHWSRLVDLPLAASIIILTPLFGQALAIKITMVAVPLLTLGAALLIIGHLAWRKFGRETAIFTCLCAGMIPALVYQFQPNRIDHHGAQILCVAIALWAIAHKSPWRGGAYAGLAIAAGTMISIEILPMAGAFGAVLAFRWLRNRDDRQWLLGFMAALAGGLIALFLATRGLGDLVAHCDVIAPAHLAFFLIAAIGTYALSFCSSLRPIGLVIGFGILAIIAAGAFVSIAPQCGGSPFGTLDPLVRTYWYEYVAEGMPVWRQKWSFGLPAMVQILIALGAVIAIVRRQKSSQSTWWKEYCALLICAILAGALTFRSIAFAGIIAAIPLGWLAQQLLYKMRNTDRPLNKVFVALAMCLILLPSSPIALAQAIMPDQSGGGDLERGNASNLSGNETAPAEITPVIAMVRESSCEIRSHTPRLNRISAGTIFAPLDIGPALLEKSHHNVVATGHHRANEAMRDVIAAFMSPADEARGIISGQGAQYVAVCLDLGEVALYKTSSSPNSLINQISQGQVPNWLEPIDLELPEAFKIYRVK